MMDDEDEDDDYVADLQMTVANDKQGTIRGEKSR